MNDSRPPRLAWLWFTLIRVGIFAVVLALLLVLLPIEPWISAIIAAVIAFCVSFIFFSRPRAAVSQQIAEARRGDRSASADDASAEDAALGNDDPERRP